MELAERFPLLFWDTDPAKVDPELHSVFIIERVLERGTHEALHAMLERYSREQVIEVIRTSRQISRLTANFWREYWNIEEPIACLRPRLPPALDKLWKS